MTCVAIIICKSADAPYRRIEVQNTLRIYSLQLQDYLRLILVKMGVYGMLYSCKHLFTIPHESIYFASSFEKQKLLFQLHHIFQPMKLNNFVIFSNKKLCFLLRVSLPKLRRFEQFIKSHILSFAIPFGVQIKNHSMFFCVFLREKIAKAYNLDRVFPIISCYIVYGPAGDFSRAEALLACNILKCS